MPNVNFKLGLTVFQLKLIGIIFMLGDHLYTFLPNYFPIWFKYTGRIVAPIFFFLAVEGFIHTQSRKDYVGRLFTAGFLMAWGNYAVNWILRSQFSSVSPSVPELYNNIFLSLALGVSILRTIVWLQTQNQLWKQIFGVFGIIFLALVLLITEASYYGIAMIFIFYFCRNSPVVLSVLYSLFCLFLFSGVLSNTLLFGRESFQWMMVFALPFFWLYNGELGNKRFKYLFYIFYPLHLWILFALGFILSGG